MTHLNIPWVESPFFNTYLKEKTHLDQQQKENATFYHKNGFLIIKNAIAEELVDAIRRELEGHLSNYFTPGDPRVMNLWKHSDSIKTLAGHKSIIDTLQMLYDRKPIPFQTLNFSHGSQQNPHSDTIHFSSSPQRFMCAAWVALEDMDEDNGTVVYYPGSHKLPLFDYSDISVTFNPVDSFPDDFYVTHYEPFIQKLMDAYNFEGKNLIVNKGDVLIWSANLIHGGLPVKDPSRTRWSQVTHYYFEDCLYYTPQLSNKPAGEWFLRKIQNITTGESTWGSYNGQQVKRKVVPGHRYIVSKYAPYNWRDFLFIFTRLYHRIFNKK